MINNICWVVALDLEVVFKLNASSSIKWAETGLTLFWCSRANHLQISELRDTN